MCTDNSRDASSGQADSAETHLHVLSRRFMAVLHRLDCHFLLREKAEHAQVLAVQHPLVAIFVAFAAVFCTLPILGFCIFVVCSLMFMVLGFLVIEGTILSFAVVVLGGILAVFGLIAASLALAIMVAWVTLNNSRSLITKVQEKLQERYSEQEAAAAARAQNAAGRVAPVTTHGSGGNQVTAKHAEANGHLMSEQASKESARTASDTH